MKRGLVLLLSSLLCACNNVEAPVSSSSQNNGPLYLEVEDLHIHYEDLFAQQGSPYYCYIYGLACQACSSLRESIVNLARIESIHFYFIYPNDDIPFAETPSQADASLGASDIQDVYCYSTPTLIEISDHIITQYLRDVAEIQNFIEAHL